MIYQCNPLLLRSDLIDLGLDCLHLVVSRAFGKQIVALALLLLDVCITAARASKYVHHRAVQNMLRRMALFRHGTNFLHRQIGHPS